MYGSSKSSPETKRKIEEAAKKAEDFFSGKTPRKTPAEAKAEHEAWKQKSMADVKARNEKAKAEALEHEKETAKRDAADLPNLQKQHAEMEATYNKGKNWEYADREQNLSPEERTARDMRGSMSQLAQRIHNVKKHGFKQGGKINLKDCSVSTHEKNSKHKNSW
jgi:membrane protein involved in colicin uptake